MLTLRLTGITNTSIIHLKKVDIAHTTDSDFLNLRGATKIYTIFDLTVFREGALISL